MNPPFFDKIGERRFHGRIELDKWFEIDADAACEDFVAQNYLEGLKGTLRH